MLFCEVLRRLLALAGVLLATWMMIYYVPAVVQLHPIDVAKEQASLVDREADALRMMAQEVGKDRLHGVSIYPEARMSPTAFLAHETKGVPVVAVSGTAWTSFIDGVFHTAQRRPPDASWRMHYGSGSLPDYLYFRRDDPRLQGATAPISVDHPVMYLTLGTGTTARYLCVTLLSGGDIPQQTSSLLIAPYRRYAPWFLLAALLAYILLPWPRRAGAIIAYRRGGGIIAPDWLAIFLMTAFFSLALLVISRDSNFHSVMATHGWGTLTAWSLCALLIGLPILLTSGANSVYALELLPQGFRLLQWGRQRDISYSEIADVAFITVGSPKWLRWFGILMLFVNALRAAPLVVLLHRSYLYLQLRLHDGRTLRLPYEGLSGGVWLLREMAEAGVPLSDDARETIALAQEHGFPPRPQLQPRMGLTAPVICLALVGITFFCWQRAPGHQLFATLPAVPKRPITNRDIQAHHHIVEQMGEAKERADAAFLRYEHTIGHQRDAAFTEYQRETDRFMALSKEAEALEKEW